MAAPIKDIVGLRFGRLQVMQVAPRKSKGRTRWVCQCDCGQIKHIDGYCLKRLTTVSCGCARRERAATLYKTNARKLRHE